EDATARDRRATAQREFVSNAAHELLTPLTGIVGAAHVLESGGKIVPETRDRFIAHIARECDRLARIARALLVLARARSGEEPPRPEIVSLRPLIDDALRRAQAATAPGSAWGSRSPRRHSRRSEGPSPSIRRRAKARGRASSFRPRASPVDDTRSRRRGRGVDCGRGRLHAARRGL